MSKRTKKVGNTGWMGPRYGIRIRRRVLDLDRARQADAACPKCSTVTVSRVASGVFECRRCRTRFASGAYLFTPPPPITRSEKIEAASAAASGGTEPAVRR
ncbi:MAG TPA: 50S ribosomal protein L37ae [Thermoplasmata archaeon]|nr:50S ribosomal protein L37ae [Thermoplasmata archaeon]